MMFLGMTTVSKANAGFTFSDVTDQTGVDFKHYDGSSGNYYLMESVSAGLALFDYDNDGLLDLHIG